MKLATYKDGSRDGQLVVVARDLSTAHYATGTATRLQQVLDDWNFLSPQLQDLYVTLNHGKARHAFPFDARLCMAPLPRACQWAVAQAGSRPEPLQTRPLMYQGSSDGFLGPRDDAWFGAATWGIDFEAGLAVISGDVGLGASAEQALNGVRLLMLANGWTLRHLVADELAAGFGYLQSKPATAFSPVAVTPDELGEAWQRGRVHLTLQTRWNGHAVGQVEAGPTMHCHFGQLIAHLAKTRQVRAGSIIGSGTVSHPDPVQGYSCIAEQRARESVEHGQPRTPYLALGDRVRIEMIGRDGLSVFGAIDQRVAGPGEPADLADSDDLGAPAGTVPPTGRA